MPFRRRLYAFIGKINGLEKSRDSFLEIRNLYSYRSHSITGSCDWHLVNLGRTDLQFVEQRHINDQTLPYQTISNSFCSSSSGERILQQEPNIFDHVTVMDNPFSNFPSINLDP